MGTRGRQGSVLRSLGHGAFYLVMGACFLGFAAVCVARIGDVPANGVDRWGTFVREYCVPQPPGWCQSVGTWISDDRTEHRMGVVLNGSVDDDGIARAQFRPSDSRSDDGRDLVHSAEPDWAGPWLPLALAVITAGAAFHYGRHRRVLPGGR